MSDYRRARITGAAYFFTVMTWKRRRWFDDEN
jgi:REP element-mobilizing transposase RayT